MMFKPQHEFLLLDKYKEKFTITDRTIFAYDGVIYTNSILPSHLVEHESCHFKQQKKYGLDNWVKSYLEDDKFRLKMEIQAYKVQLRSVKDRNQRNFIRMKCAEDLSSSLYGNLLNYDEAFKIINC